MTFCDSSPDEVFGDSFLDRDGLHLFSDDAALGICDNTHALQLRLKDKINACFFISELNFACSGNN
jgi:hypothetical protein